MIKKSKKTQSERYLQSTIKVVVSIMFILFLMNFISAEEWTTFDNVKRYDEATKTVTIVNTFGVGRDIATATLNTPHINQVLVGYSKIAEFKINPLEDYESFLKEITYIDLKTNKEVVKEVDVKYWGLKTILVDDIVCSDIINEKNVTKNDICEVIGKKEIQIYDWIDWDKSVYENKEVLVGLFMNIGFDETYEWIPNIAGIKVSEWAVVTTGATTTYMDIGGKNYTILTYLNNGTFNYTNLDPLNISILVVAGGGGGGGGNYNGAGGGAGGLIYNNSFDLANGNYDIVVGQGGAGGVTSGNSSQGQNSSAFGLVAIGGGKAGQFNAGNNGGSGGGGSYGSGAGNNSGGIGLQPTSASGGFGNNGGAYFYEQDTGGGGGGAGASGSSKNGGAGLFYNIYNGTSLCYAGGGGGADQQEGRLGTAGCGGGAGSTGTGISGINGTGGGGGGAERLGTATGGMGGSGIVIIRYSAEDLAKVPSVTLNSPTAYQNFTTSSITFNTSVLEYNDGGVITNVILYIDGVLNETDTSEINGTYLFNKTLSEGKHNWSILAYNNNSNSNQSETREFWIDTITPALEVFFPTNTTYYLPMFETINNYTIYLNWSVNDTNKDKCWYSNDSGVTNRTVTCSDNQTKEFKTRGNYTFDFWANDTFGFVNYSKVYFEIDDKIFQTSRIFNETDIYETLTDNITINLDANSSLTNVYLNYNGTTLPTTNSGTLWWYPKLLENEDVGNNTLYWIATYAGTNYTSNNSYQQVSLIHWIVCNATYNVPYLNISFKDESNDSNILGDVPSSTWIYYLGNGTENKTYSYSTASFNENYTLCLSPPNKTVYVDYVFQYSGITYPQRTYNPTLLSFSNVTINKTLYLLSNADGIYVTFQVINAAEQPIEGVFVNASRSIDGTTTVVGEGTTGADGGVTFWLNPDFLHTIYFVKTGYTTYISSLQPTQSIYTVSLGATSSSTNYDYTKGINIKVSPTNTSLYNDTTYNFSVILSSSYWDVTSFGYSILNGTGTILDTKSASTNGGTLYSELDTSGNSSLKMNFYYVVNSTYTNYTYYWNVLNSEGTDWSIKKFATDLKSYADAGIFGLKTGTFAFGILMFLIIMVFTGIMSYKFGLTSPATISAAIFAIVFLLDVGLGLLDTLNPVNAISHFPTIFVLIVTIALVIRESAR